VELKGSIYLRNTQGTMIHQWVIGWHK